jgi:MFS family permease
MNKIKSFFSHRNLVILSLFAISCLHAIAFGFVQYPSNFLTAHVSRTFHTGLIIVLYSTALIMALFYRWYTRRWGIKSSLIIGLILYFFGLIFLQTPQYYFDIFLIDYICLAIGMIFLGTAFSMVFIGLITYLTIEIPKNLGMSIIILFAFMNLGAMLSSILLNLFTSWNAGLYLLLVLECLIVISILYIHFYLSSPIIPEYLYQKKSHDLWKKMGYRLFLFILTIVLYGICENTFNLYGEQFLTFFLEPKVIHNTISIFWLFMILGQILMLFPLYFISARNIYYFLIFLMIVALLAFPFQTNLPGFLIILALGGTACAAIFPILLAMLEEEIKEIDIFTTYKNILPYLEMSTAWMIIGYLIGTGLVTIRSSLQISFTFKETEQHFFIAIGYAVIMLVIAIYLFLSFKPQKRPNFLLMAWYKFFKKDSF